MRLYYRISDASYSKPKLPGADKESCFWNLLRAFADTVSLTSTSEAVIVIVADRCKKKTLDFLRLTPFKLIETDLGNAGSLRYAVEHAVEHSHNADLVYFCEDDYFHQEDSDKVFREGIEIAEYITLFDHPDKYTKLYDYGEISKVVRTKSRHWRYTVSTCMTFGSRVSTLKSDLEIWRKHTEGAHPYDHEIFVTLGLNDRRLAVCIPGAACHTDLTFSGRCNEVLVDNWAIAEAIEWLEARLQKIDDEDFQKLIRDVLGTGRKGWDRLKMLDALYQSRNKLRTAS